jgi:threonine aldolase
MREAMARAEVGDDVLGEDPSVNALQLRVADLVGKEAALFVPSGTMANLLAAVSQTRPGDTLVLDESAHPFHFESGGVGMVAGLMTKTLPGTYGVLSPEQVERSLVLQTDHHFSPTTLVSIENTTNRGGGAVYPVETVAAIGDVVHKHGLRLHCDGARIFNACAAIHADVKGYARHCDTLSFCFSKGLGAPVGSILCGDAGAIDRAHRYRKMLGGGMRQAGILATAALYALDHHRDRLSEDHERAKRFRSALDGVPGITFPLPSPTNIVFLEVPDASSFVAALKVRRILAGATGPTQIRVVFHLDIGDSALETAIAGFREVAGLF